VKSTFTPYTEEIDSVGEDLPSCPVLSRPVLRFALSESLDHSMRECGILVASLLLVDFIVAELNVN
jgi:hypothetical protein